MTGVIGGGPSALGKGVQPHAKAAKAAKEIAIRTFHAFATLAAFA
jgi:hypothetical protein